MEVMEPDRSLTRRQERNLLKAAANVTRTQYDCPERAGCPALEALDLLARRRSPLEDSRELVDHIGTCSPCFIQYSRYRAAHKRRLAIRYALIPAATVVVLAIVTTPFLRTPSGRLSPVTKEVDAPPQPVTQMAKLVLDLRKRGVTRGDVPDRPSPESILHLPRANVALSSGIWNLGVFSRRCT